MKNRVLSVLMLSIALATAPGAFAQCMKCKPLNHTCPVVTSGGFDACYWLGPDCILGEFCGTQAAATRPLAADYRVASVERVNAPRQPKSNEVRVAAAEPAPAVHR